MESRLLPIFTPEERKENEERKKRLTDLILSEQAILVVGAGSSAELGYPTWSKLLEKLEQLAENCGNNFQRNETVKENDSLKYVEIIKEHIKKNDGDLKKYYKEIYKLFSPSSVNPLFNEFHKNLASLPFKGILTTNYDMVFEYTLAALNSPVNYIGKTLTVNGKMPNHVSDFFLTLNFNRPSNQVLHLHGYYDKPDRIILSEKDYINSYGLKPKEESEEFEEIGPSWSLHRKVLWSILATRRSVWLGFSMRDPYLKKMLEMVSNDLWRWDEAIHFVVMSINDENADHIKLLVKQFKLEYGMEIVFYESTKTDHSGLKQYIESVYERYKRKKDQSEKPKSLEEHETRINSQIPGAPQNVDKRNSSEWLDRINQIMEERI